MHPSPMASSITCRFPLSSFSLNSPHPTVPRTRRTPLFPTLTTPPTAGLFLFIKTACHYYAPNRPSGFTCAHKQTCLFSLPLCNPEKRKASKLIIIDFNTDSCFLFLASFFPCLSVSSFPARINTCTVSYRYTDAYHLGTVALFGWWLK